MPIRSAIFWVAACALPVAGQVEILSPAESGAAAARPDMSRRVVAIFDFEEAASNPLAVPLNWYRVHDDPSASSPPAGFSIFNRAELDYSTAFRGYGSVRLPTAGGSTRLRLGPAVLPIFASADYLVSARVRTRGLTHARAGIVGRFLDQFGAPIGSSEVRSELVQSEGEWRPVSLLLPGDFEHAAFIQIDLDLLQPSEAGPPGASLHRVRAEDSDGDAWFDDVAVIQLPRIQLSTASPGNVVIQPEKPELTIFIRDLTGEALRGRIIVQDAWGREAARWEQPIAAGRMRTRWTPPLERLGWYRATLEMVGADFRVGAAYVDFVWLPRAPAVAVGGPRSPDRARFGLVVRSLSPLERGLVPELARRTGVGAVTLPAWPADLTRATADDYVAALKPTVDALLAQWQAVTFGLSEVPTELVARFPTSDGDPLAILAQPEAEWSGLLYPLLDKYGQSVRRWELGPPGDDLTFRDRMLPWRLERADEVISRLVPGPRFVIPWRADRAFTPEVLGTRRDDLDILVPCAMPPEAVGEYAGALREDLGSAGGLGRVGLVFETLPAVFGPAAGAAGLVKRMVEFWAALGADGPGRGPGSARAAVVQPWEWVGPRRGQLMPRAELAAWRAVVDHLQDRRIRGGFPIGEGIRAFVLAPADGAPPGRGGALVAWRESAPPERSGIDQFLGAGELRAVDMFGNARPVPLRPGGTDRTGVAFSPVHTLEVGDEPVFVEGVDVELLDFLTGLRLEPSFLSSESLRHECELVVANPWGMTASGRISIVQPGGFTEAGTLDKSWTITPRSQDFSVPPGGTLRLPLSIAFTPAQAAGSQRLVVDLDVSARADYSRVRFAVPFDVGLEEMSLDLGYRLEPGATGTDVVVEVRTANRSKAPLTVEITGFAPGFSRQGSSIGRLPPGEHALRQFVFPGALERLRGQAVSVSVENIESKARLNKFITIE